MRVIFCKIFVSLLRRFKEMSVWWQLKLNQEQRNAEKIKKAFKNSPFSASILKLPTNFDNFDKLDKFSCTRILNGICFY